MSAVFSRRQFISWASKATITAGMLSGAGGALLTACGNSSGSAGTPTITYSYPAFAGVPKDLPLVQNALNAITREKINTIVKLAAGDASWEQKTQLSFAAGQPADLVFTSNWLNNFYQLVSNKDLLSLDSLLPQYAPGTYASLSRQTWNAAKVDGHIYASINQQLFPSFWGVQPRQDMAQKYNFDKQSIHSYDDFEPFLARVKAGESKVIPTLTTSGGDWPFHPTSIGYDPLAGGDGEFGVAMMKVDDSRLKVLNEATTPEFQHAVTLAHDWYQKGYFAKNLPPDENTDTDLSAGKYASQLGQSRPDGTALQDGYAYIPVYWYNPVVTTNDITGTLTAITQASKHPSNAMQFIELLNTDKDAFNLINFGIAGKHYSVIDKTHGVIQYTGGANNVQNLGYYTGGGGRGWQFGNVFNGYYTDPSEVGLWDKCKAINEHATISRALGFSFDATPVKTQWAGLQAVIKQYGQPLLLGQVDPATALPQYLNQLEAAGIAQVLTEMQNQVDNWKKTSGKG